MKIQHTPGPLYSCPMGRVYADHLRDAIAQCHGPYAAANAQLFAAAPDLLYEAMELLRNATYADGQATVLTKDCEALEAAIAKAVQS